MCLYLQQARGSFIYSSTQVPKVLSAWTISYYCKNFCVKEMSFG